MFFAIHFFFANLNSKNKINSLIIFFIFFFIYIGNWEWVFWKLADIYFLFIFSLCFYFYLKAIVKKKYKNFYYSTIFLILCLFTKPQGLAVVPFFITGLILLYFDKISLFKFLLFSFIFYLIFFPLFAFFLIKNNYSNLIVTFMSEGHINGLTFFTYENYLKNLSLDNNVFVELSYYYILFLNKIFYQITFLRETYSLRHNIFLFFYVSTFYFFLIINLNFLLKNYPKFFKMTILITFFSILMHASTALSAEPNRHQLFMLVPLYILASISIKNTIDKLVFDKD